jgi:hypothetical protein
MDEKPLLSETIRAGKEDLSGGRRGAQLEILLLNGTTEEGGFSPTYCIQTLQSMYFIVASWPGQLFFSKEWCCWETLCLSQEAVDGGSVAAQATHNCCRRYSFLLLGHEPHFLRH